MPRVVAVGMPHHITQRGNHRREVFLRDGQKQCYLQLLGEQARYHELRLLAYCVMTNHVHLVVIPEREDSMAGALRGAHGRFAQYWNTELQKVGHMWQNRYYSCPMEAARVWAVTRYVELNPVRAAMVSEAADYEWSSARAHVTGVDPAGLLDMRWWSDNWEGDWGEAIRADGAASVADEIRRATYTGRPLGSAGFVDGLERTLGRRLKPSKGGRPRKTKLDGRQVSAGK